jgi:hypothetical protein
VSAFTRLPQHRRDFFAAAAHEMFERRKEEFANAAS